MNQIDRFDDVVTVIDVIYRSEHSDWAVLDIADSQWEPLDIVGLGLASYAQRDTPLKVSGVWRDGRYGWQVHVRSAAPVLILPEVPKDVVSLLQRIPYVGAKRAQLLIDRYGADVDAVVRAIDANPDRAFSAVAGLRSREASAARRWWRAQRLHRARWVA